MSPKRLTTAPPHPHVPSIKGLSGSACARCGDGFLAGVHAPPDGWGKPWTRDQLDAAEQWCPKGDPSETPWDSHCQHWWDAGPCCRCGSDEGDKGDAESARPGNQPETQQ